MRGATKAKHDPQRLGIAWWNTSLSPNAAVGRASASDYQNAIQVIESITGSGVSLFGLAEISARDVDVVQVAGALPGFVVTEQDRPAGRSKFDTCIAFDPRKFSLLDKGDVVKTRGEKTLRIGQRFRFGVSGATNALHVLVSHWPSKMHSSGLPVGDAYAHHMREAVDAILSDEPAAQILLMGDYNDEPHSPNMSYHLRSTRDREFAVKRSGGLLYNPFWRHLSPRCPSTTRWPSHDHGTYHYAGEMTKWHTFDQMLFSRSMLDGKGDWRLDEGRVEIFIDHSLKTLVQTATIFDHLPIMANLVRV